MKCSGLLGCKRSSKPTVTDYNMTVSWVSSSPLPPTLPFSPSSSSCSRGSSSSSRASCCSSRRLPCPTFKSRLWKVKYRPESKAQLPRHSDQRCEWRVVSAAFSGIVQALHGRAREKRKWDRSRSVDVFLSGNVKSISTVKGVHLGRTGATAAHLMWRGFYNPSET